MPKKIPYRVVKEVLLDQRHCAKLSCHVVTSCSQLGKLTRDEGSVSPVDFSSELIVLICRGECPTGGYSVKVQSVWIEENELFIEVELIDPAPGSFVTLAMTYPQTAVALRRGHLRELPERLVLRDKGSNELLTTVEL